MTAQMESNASSVRRVRSDVGSMHGILNVDKPPSLTTMEVVRRLKRASRQRRVGHGGTLDPVATGVVAICFGQATRVMEYLVNGTREYRSTIELGVETDTYDVLGRVTGIVNPSAITLEHVEGALESFRGTVEQVPPMYSALKRQGKRLYHLARAGIEVEREPRTVEVSSIKVVDWSPPAVTLVMRCGRGFYVRSLAHDLGGVLGCGAHMKTLVRLRSGPFELSDALSLEQAEQKLGDGTWIESLYVADVVVGHLRAAIVDRRLEQMIRQGRPIPPGLRIPFSRPDELCRVYGPDGKFVAVLSFNASKGHWQPDRVFNIS